MKTKITKLEEMGFCHGVKRAIRLLEKSAAKNASVDCFGELVHNAQVMHRLKDQGIRVIKSREEINSPVVAISAHGLSPQSESELRSGQSRIIDATCPSVKSVQRAAQRLAEDGHTVVVFGDTGHIEVQGILGWAQGKGIAAMDADKLFQDQAWPIKIGILSQTTQVPESYLTFVKAVLDKALTGNSEITILDTVCQEVRRRQSLSRSLAARSDLILVVGGRNSANSRRLVELCAALTETHLVEKADEIDPAWLEGKCNIGITSGTSTSDESIDEVISRLEKLTG